MKGRASVNYCFHGIQKMLWYMLELSGGMVGVSGLTAALHVLQLRAEVPEARHDARVKAGVADHIWALDEIVGLLDSN